ncbi:RHS repeat-associated core domain-containing protein [Comamonas testosteroni]
MRGSQIIPINQIFGRFCQRSERSISTWILQLLAIAIALYACFPSPTFAQATGSQRYTLYIDMDGGANSGTTGCSATVQDASGSQSLSGIDYQVNIDTTQDTTGATVNAVTLAACSNNAWGSPAPVESGARKLASTTAAGKITEHIEAAIPMAQLGVKPGQYLTLNVGASGDYLISPVSGQGNGSIGLTVPNPQASSATPVPLMSAALIAALAAAMAVAGWWGIKTGRIKGNAVVAICTIVLASSALVTGVVSAANALSKLSIHDTSIADWAGISALATDPEGDNVLNTPDLMALYGAISDGQLFIRIDANAGRTDGGPVDPVNPDPLGLKNPTLSVTHAQQLEVAKPWSLQVEAKDADGKPLSVVVVRSSKTPGALTASGGNPAQLNWTPTSVDVGEHLITLSATDGQGRTTTQSLLLSVTNPADIPADPSKEATTLQLGTPFAQSSEFLYKGPNPTQKDIDPTVISPEKAIVFRGKVTDRNGNPLPGVTVSVWGHPEFGHTQTRSDGWFDMAANGLGMMVLEYSKPGYMKAQRKLDTNWRDFNIAEEVALITLDSRATAIALGSEQWQVGMGSTTNDMRGQRTALALFPPNTQAQLKLADGSAQPLPQLTFRATEYTMGETGPNAMPGMLPISVGYTYAVELSSDEAIAAGAKSVQLSQPIPFYLENFLEFPIGETVPLGWYDYDQATWIGSENGRVISILSIDAGKATVQVSKDARPATPAELSSLGLSDQELAVLGQIYPAGKKLWRTRISHFTPWDLNQPYGPPNDADGPPEPPADPDDDTCKSGQDCCAKAGCDIFQDRSLGQGIAIPGSPFNLYYDSRKTSAASYRVPLLKKDKPVPASLKKIKVRADIAGQRLEHTAYGPFKEGAFWDFEWNGKDAYGRFMPQGAKAQIGVQHVYPLVYYASSAGAGSAFSALSSRAGGGVGMSRDSGNTEFYATMSWTTFLKNDSPDVFVSNAGGWVLTGLKYYDKSNGRLYTGGQQPEIAKVSLQDFAKVAKLESPKSGIYFSIFIASKNGGFYGLASSDGTNIGNLIYKIATDGSYELIAGIEYQTGYTGDGGPAKNALLHRVRDIAEGIDGSLYVADQGGSAVRLIETSGTIRTLNTKDAGSGQLDIQKFAIDADNNIFYIKNNSTLGQIASNGESSSININDASSIYDVKNDSRGGIWIFLYSGAYKILYISPGGSIKLMAGGGSGLDDGQGIELDINYSESMIPDNGGGLYFYDSKRGYYRYVNGSGVVGTTGIKDKFFLNSAKELWRIDNYIYKQTGKLPGYANGDSYVLRDDGLFADVFDLRGKIKSTVNAFSGASIIEYGYNGDHIASVKTADGDTALINRDGSGRITSIRGFDDQVTTFSYDAMGMLSKVSLPGGGVHQMAYGTDLVSQKRLASYTDPNGNTDKFGWSDGRLAWNKDAAGGGWSLGTAEENFAGQKRKFNILTSAEGRVFKYSQPLQQYYSSEKIIINPDGLVKKWTSSPYYSNNFSTTYENGLRHSLSDYSSRGYGADGYNSSSNTKDEYIYFTGSFDSIYNRVNVSSNIGSGVWSASWNENGISSKIDYRNGYLELTGPLGEKAYASVDDQMRPTSVTPTDGASVSIERDGKGRPTRIQSDGYSSVQDQTPVSSTRFAQMAYHAAGNGKGQLASITNALGQESKFEYDAKGQLTNSAGPDGRSVEYRYDPVGNMTSLRTPAGVEHRFSWNAINNPASYDIASKATTWAYNLDRELTKITRPGGQSIAITYDLGGRPSSIQHGQGTTNITYDNVGAPTSIALGSNKIDIDYTNVIPSGTRWSGDINGSVQRNLNRSILATKIDITAGSSAYSLPFEYDALKRVSKFGDLSIGRKADGRLSTTSFKKYASTYHYNSFMEVGRTSHVAPGSIFIPNKQADLVALASKASLLTAAVLPEVIKQDNCSSSGWWDTTDGIRWVPDDKYLDADTRSQYLTQYGSPVTREPNYCVELVRNELESIEVWIAQDGASLAGIQQALSSLEGRLKGGPCLITGWDYLPCTSFVSPAIQVIFDEMNALLNAMLANTSTYGFAAQFDYERDDIGRITAQKEQLIGGQSTYQYSYDNSGRLVSYTKDGTQTTWSFDANGNRTHENGTPIATYDTEDRLLTWKGNTYQYNDAGDLLSKTTVAGKTDYVYDSLGNLRSVKLADNTSIEYIIDPANRRIGKRKNGVLQYGLLYLDSLRPIAQLDAAGAIKSVFLYGDNLNSPSGMQRDGKQYKFISDHLGSVRLVIDTQTGEVKQRLDYDAWGNVTEDTNPNFQPFGFAGGLYDPDTGLTRFGARDYDAETGRWTAKDPILFYGGDSNLYGYALNNPIHFVDPTGEFGIPGAIAGGIVGAISGAVGASINGGNVLTGALIGGLGGAVVGGLGPLIGPSLAGQAFSRALSGALGNVLGQSQKIGSENFCGFNIGSIIGSSVGGALSAILAPATYGVSFSSFGSTINQIIPRAISGIPGASVSFTGSMVGTQAGKK